MVAAPLVSVTSSPTSGSARLAELGRLERLVDAGLSTFVEVGEALLEIRDRRLYRATHKSFGIYCQERWGLGRAHAHRLIASSQVVRVLSPVGDVPENERQARELTPLLSDPERLRDAWVLARREPNTAGGSVDHRTVKRAVAEVTGSDGGHLIGTDQWETPSDLFAVLDGEFRFQLDVCAVAANHGLRARRSGQREQRE